MRKEMARYLITGVITTFVSIDVYYICVLTILDPRHPVQLQIANVISWIAAVSFAYIASRRYVFDSHDPDLFSEGAKFFASRVATLLIDMSLMFMLVTLIGANDKLAKILVQVIVVAGNYVFSKYFVFKSKTNEMTLKQDEGSGSKMIEKRKDN